MQKRILGEGRLTVGSFFASDSTCDICRSGYQLTCPHREAFGPTRAAQAVRMPAPPADGTLVATAQVPDDDLIPHFLATSDSLMTGWFAFAARGRPGQTVALVGDGAVGLMGISPPSSLARSGSSRWAGTNRASISPWSSAHRHRHRMRGDGAAAFMDLTEGLGRDSVIEAGGTQQSTMQPIRSTPAGVTLAMSVSPTKFPSTGWTFCSHTCTFTGVRPRSDGS